MKSPTRIPGRRLLHSPGPTPLPDEVLHALMRQPMDMGDPRNDETIAACEAGLKQVLQTQSADVFFYACNGHGAWEAAIENLLPPGGTVLIPGTGHFSESWAVQTEALGRKVVRTPWVEGLPIDPAVVTAALRAALDAADHPALFVVDVVASLGAEPFDFDGQRVDMAVGASQKGLMCPPGVGFLACNAAAFAAAERNPSPRFYWDIVRRKSELSYRKFCGTPPQNLMGALAVSLGLIQREGLQNVLARHQLLASLVHAAVEGWSEGGALGFFARDPASRSNAVTTVTVPAGTDVDGLRALAREQYQLAFAGALGPLQGRGFRIGHLGDQNPAQILGALATVEAALEAQGIPLGAGVSGGGTRRALLKLAGR